MIKGQTKAICNFRLDLMHLSAIFCDGHTGFGGGQFGGRAMFVRCADKQHFVASRPLKAGK